MNTNGSEYTSETRNWLNSRFDLFDETGIYIPNQPVYGYSAEAFRLEEYARLYAVLRILNRLNFRSLVDVGCADGYAPALIQKLFNTSVLGLDLSDKALLRSRELFKVAGAACDAHGLPLPDNCCDVAICNEVLEHVVSPEKVITELLRISRGYVLLSTPRASGEAEQKQHFDTLDPNEPHAHIHYFTDGQIRELCGPNAYYMGARTRFVNSLFDRLAWTDESTLSQRKSYYQFTITTSDLGDVYKNTIHRMLIDRYVDSAFWKKYLMTRFGTGLLLQVDGLMAASYPQFALDHLVLIPSPEIKTHKWIYSKRSHYTLLKTLLGGFSVPPLSRSHA